MKSGVQPQLEIKLAGVNSGKWQLRTNDNSSNLAPPFDLRLLDPKQGYWSWEGKIVLVPQPDAWPAGGEGSSAPLDPPLLECTLSAEFDGKRVVTETLLLAPAEVWVLAGGASVAPGLPSPSNTPWIVFKDAVSASVADGSVVRPGAAAPAGSELALAFANSWQEDCAKLHRFRCPLLLIVQPYPGMLLGNIVEAKNKAKNFPKQPPPQSGQINDQDTAGFPCFACRGLVWWHGEYEAEMASAAAEREWTPVSSESIPAPLRPPVPFTSEGETPDANIGLRDNYAGLLAGAVLRDWWSRAARQIDPDSPGSVEGKVNKQYQSLLQIVLAQIPAVRGNVPPDQAAFSKYWRALPGNAKPGYAAPVSTVAAIRYAQFDVVRQLQALAARNPLPFNFLKELKVDPDTPEEKRDPVPAVALCPLIANSSASENGRLLATAAREKPPGVEVEVEKGPDGRKVRLIHLRAKADPALWKALEFTVAGSAEIRSIPAEAIQVGKDDLVVTLPAAPAGGSLRTPPADDPAGALQLFGGMTQPPEGANVEFDIPLPP